MMRLHRQYSATARRVEPVSLREIADMIKGRDVISLAAGWPDPDCYPTDVISELIATAMEDRASEMFAYGTTKGYQPLRQEIVEHLNDKYNTNLTPENILITTGAQQGLYLVARTLLDDEDDFIVGSPTYPAALSVANSVAYTNVLDSPLDGNGIQTEILSRKLPGATPKLAYTNPTFQNPSGITMSKSRREELADLADEHDFIIVEDHPYTELRYDGSHIDPFVKIAPERSVYLGTFSKILAPGFRTGWIAADQDLIRKMEVLKQPIDLQSNIFTQHVIYEYMRTGAMKTQINLLRDTYSAKREIMLEELRKEMPDTVDWTSPDGGMFVWVTLPQKIDAEELFTQALDDGVAFIPGYSFYPNDVEKNTLRLSFTHPDGDEIRNGIQRLAESIRAY